VNCPSSTPDPLSLHHRRLLLLLLAGASPAAESGRSSRLVLSFFSGTSYSKQFLQWIRVLVRLRGVILATSVTMKTVFWKMRFRSGQNSVQPSGKSRQPRMLRLLRELLRGLLKPRRERNHESTTSK
jgi:hypothetical protein